MTKHKENNEEKPHKETKNNEKEHHEKKKEKHEAKLLICDFCGDLSLLHEIKCNPFHFSSKFTPKIIISSLDSWEACDQCKYYIDNNLRDELNQRSFTTFMAKHYGYELPAKAQEIIREELKELHEKFWENKI